MSRIGAVQIHCIAVGIGDDRNVVGGFRAPFNFKAANPRCGKLVNMFNHTQVFGIENVASALILFNGKV